MPSRPSLSTLTSSQRLRASPADSALSAAEHPGMAHAQLGRHAERDVHPRADLGLLAQQRQERRLEEQVAELVEQLRREPGLAHRVGDLVGLLDGVRDDRGRRLGPIPRAFAAQHAPSARAARPRRACAAWRASSGRSGSVRHRGQAARQRVGARRRARRRVAAPLVEADAERLEPAPRAARAASCGATLPGRAQRLERRGGHELGLARAERDDQRAEAPRRRRSLRGRDRRRVARRELDVLAELDLTAAANSLRDVLLARLLDELRADLRLERRVERPRALRAARARRPRSGASRTAILVGVETTPWSSVNATSANGLTRLVRLTTPRSPPLVFVLSVEYFFASSREARVRGLELRVDLVGERLRLDQDVTHLAALGQRVERGLVLRRTEP